MKKDELKTNNGKDGKPAYVSYKGKIYDVSKSRLWAGGVHMGRHNAGNELSDYLSMAPHGEEVFQRVDPVGELSADDESHRPDKKDLYRALYRKFHPHPMVIHFPIALFIFGAFMQFLFSLIGMDSFEKSAYYSISFATLTAFPTVLSGFLSWWINYDMTMTAIFRTKIIFSVILIVSGITAVTLRTLYPGIASGQGNLTAFYTGIVFLNVPFTGIIAYNGGRITWHS